ncbi:MAG: cytochrome P450 [Pseudomonadota bacterium]
MSIAAIDHRPKSRAPLIPPTPPRAPDDLSAIGRLAAIRHNAIASWGDRAYQDDVVRGRFFTHASYILNTPDAIRHVLIDNADNYRRTATGIRVLRPMLGEGLLLAEGRAWKHQRRTLAPAFTPRAVATLIPHMLSATDETVASLRRNLGSPVDLREAMQHLALEIAGRTMFSFEMGTHGQALRNFVVDYGTRLASPRFLDLLLPLGWPTPQDISRARFRRRWTRFIGELIAARRTAGKPEGAPPRDLFELMLAARDPETGEAFSDDQLGDQVATMILAGHETTATALFWALYLLAMDGEAQDRIAAEVHRLGSDVVEIERLPFTRAVLEETLRLYPPAFLIVREAAGSDHVAGFPVRKHDVMLIAPWLLHRHEKLWSDPGTFVPERFLPGASPPDRFAYLPFGVGPRVCIGAHFALVEATLALAKIVGAFHVELIDRDPVLPIGVVTTQPDHSPPFRLTSR